MTNKEKSIERLDLIYKKIKEAIDSGCEPYYDFTFELKEIPFIDRSVSSFKQHEQSGKFSITINCY